MRGWAGPLLEIAVALARGRRMPAVLAIARLGQVVTDDSRRHGEIEAYTDIALSSLWGSAADTARATMARRRADLAPLERAIEG